MGKITVAMYVTLDGVMETPSWTGPYWEDELSDYQDHAQREAQALLLGRITFEQFAQAWPNSRDEGAPFMNGIDKYVPTHTLKDAYWKAQFIHEDVAGTIKRLKEKQNLLVYGSGQLVRFLLKQGLVDEYREMVFPVLLGSGRKLFEGFQGKAAFSSLESRQTARNVLLNTYRK